MDTTSASNDDVLTCIDTSIRDLNELRNIFLQREEIPPLDPEQRLKVRRILYSFLDQIKGLEKVFNNAFQLDQTMDDADPDTSFAQQGTTVVEPMLVLNPAESAGQFKSEICMNEKETKEPRYLYLSDGLVIWCLELKQRKHQSYDNNGVPSLPTTTTFKLMEAGFPIAAGLFKLRSYLYMIGGQQVSPCPPIKPSDVYYQKPGGANLYEYIAKKRLIKGSSCVTYRLTSDGGRISPIPCEIPELKDPKIWPVIEEIDGRLHVIDSMPDGFFTFLASETGKFSHEVLNADDLGQGCTRIQTTDAIGEEEIVCSHLVVGNRIYSTTSDDDYLMFDNTTDKWEARPIEKGGVPFDPFCVEHVLHILRLGNGRCVGKFLPSVEPLFTVIALVQNMAMFDVSLEVVAYLVSPTGRVLCFQHLPDFFENEQSGPRPDVYLGGTVIRVDEQGEMMCAVVNVRSSLKFKGDFLFINMFTVEGLADAASKVDKILNDSAYKAAVELEFVRVVVEESYVFETASDPDLSDFSRVQACFI